MCHVSVKMDEKGHSLCYLSVTMDEKGHSLCYLSVTMDEKGHSLCYLSVTMDHKVNKKERTRLFLLSSDLGQRRTFPRYCTGNQPPPLLKYTYVTCVCVGGGGGDI